MLQQIYNSLEYYTSPPAADATLTLQGPYKWLCTNTPQKNVDDRKTTNKASGRVDFFSTDVQLHDRQFSEPRTLPSSSYTPFHISCKVNCISNPAASCGENAVYPACRQADQFSDLRCIISSVLAHTHCLPGTDPFGPRPLNLITLISMP